MPRVDLSGGQWAQMRERITRGGRVDAEKYIAANRPPDDDDGTRGFELMAAIEQRVVAGMVVAWSLDGPSSADAMSDLDDEDFEALLAVAKPSIDRILTVRAKAKTDAEAGATEASGLDPKSPTSSDDSASPDSTSGSSAGSPPTT